MAREFAQLASDAASRLGDNPVVAAFSSLSIRVATDLERTAGQARERFEALAG
jgi:hypothetical protein